MLFGLIFRAQESEIIRQQRLAELQEEPSAYDKVVLVIRSAIGPETMCLTRYCGHSSRLQMTHNGVHEHQASRTR
jgi:hypothetical protein